MVCSTIQTAPRPNARHDWALVIYRRRPKGNKGKRENMDVRSNAHSSLHRYNITKVTLFHTLHCRAADVLRMTCGVKTGTLPPLPPKQTAAAQAGAAPQAALPQNINRAILNFAV